MYSGWGSEEARIAMTLYTDAFVIQGSLATRQRRLSDVLNFAEEEFIILADATLEGLGGHGGKHVAPNAQINLGAVLFAVASDTVATIPELRTPKVPETTLISIPPFSVTGHIHLLPDRDVRLALQDLHGRFVPVTDATFWSDSLGEPRRTAPMIAVNHARAQILSPYGEPAGAPRSPEAPGEPAPEGPAGS